MCVHNKDKNKIKFTPKWSFCSCRDNLLDGKFFFFSAPLSIIDLIMITIYIAYSAMISIFPPSSPHKHYTTYEDSNILPWAPIAISRILSKKCEGDGNLSKVKEEICVCVMWCGERQAVHISVIVSCKNSFLIFRPFILSRLFL